MPDEMTQTDWRLSLKQAFTAKRAWLSFGLSFGLLALFASLIPIESAIHALGHVTLPWIGMAFVLHYGTYGFRGLRWQRMLKPAGFQGRATRLTQVLFLLQSVDCVIPAKLGDLYGAHLVNINFALDRLLALGSIILWRVMDFVAVTAVAAIAAGLVFGWRIPPEIMAGGQTAVLLILGLLLAGGALFRYRRRLVTMLPRQFHSLIQSFQAGFRIAPRQIPLLTALTVLAWAAEAGRLYSVCLAVEIPLPVASVVLVALGAVLFTAVPFTPAGLGAVELAMFKLLTLTGLNASEASVLIILDRLISYWSQIALGILLVSLHRPLRLKIWLAPDRPNHHLAAPSAQRVSDLPAKTGTPE